MFKLLLLKLLMQPVAISFSIALYSVGSHTSFLWNILALLLGLFAAKVVATALSKGNLHYGKNIRESIR